ncbi:cytochrome P450 52A11 [Karstenula rhodostoma CBS 690.94]|uniref:Cytochrome P450 52A11 n=1 Tax=Karstenula rhodostoma CBS 690.94 TaxID=1392251 RepID=A0A9P4UBA0_9PLEO|nr:cytochrome P450 52A11 [Karstenula rhodostoma CBS 690.94]
MAIFQLFMSQSLNSSSFLDWRLLFLALVPLSLVYCFFGRKGSEGIDITKYSHLPQPAPADPVRGHWPWLEKIAAEGDVRRAFDEMLYEQCIKMDFPPVLLVDLRPVEKYLLLFIFDNGVAEQVTKASKQYFASMPKHPGLQRLAPLAGARSLVTTDGNEWKALRKRIMPGMAPAHLLTLVGSILDKTETYIDLLEEKAKTGEEINLESYTTNLVVDVIGIVTFNMDLNAQIEGKEGNVLLTYRALSQAFNKRPLGAVWWKEYFTKNEREIRRLDRKLDAILKEEIRRQHNEILAGADTTSRCVAMLSLQGIDKLTPEILQQTSDTLRGFLFAGHDTTSILLQWCFYELHRRPASATDLKAELDAVFGPDTSPASVIKQLRGPDAGKLLARLPYTDAVIKEALRLHPPGTTARMTPKGSGSTITLPDGQRLVVDGLGLTPRSYIMHRHPSIFGETRDDFMPERWVGDAAAKIPDSAFRPYERGPRRCTGSELANLQARIVLAAVARRFEFVKVGLGELELDEEGLPTLDGKGYYKTKSTMFSTYLATLRPVDGMQSKVKIKAGPQDRKDSLV